MEQTIVKSKKKAFFNYSTKDLQSALKELAAYPASKLRVVAKKYNVPHVTLRRKLERGESAKGIMGPKTVLTADEEILLERWILARAKIGLPLNKEELCETVKLILDRDASRNAPFKDNLPGKKWFYSFLKRHPAVSSEMERKKERSSELESRKGQNVREDTQRASGHADRCRDKETGASSRLENITKEYKISLNNENELPLDLSVITANTPGSCK